MDKRTQQAIEETQRLLDKALSYSVDFQKPEQIRYYRAHIAHLQGKGPRAVADLTKWDAMNVVIAAQAAG
jgi:hypothetical protein